MISKILEKDLQISLTGGVFHFLNIAPFLTPSGGIILVEVPAESREVNISMLKHICLF